ncbi:MAG: hypothetical protein EOL97_08585 [Spirochaetia bacterium]|nr:hypothetical protein [Spirochaetia bacterium]
MFNAEEFKPKTGGGSKVLDPGTHKCQIVSIALQAPPYKPESYYVTCLVEGLPEGDGFEGIARDKNNPTLGNYEGKIAYVNNGMYSFDTWQPPKGDTITRDEQIFNYVMNIARNLGVLEKIQADKFTANTIEDFVTGIQKYICGVWGYFTIAGKEYYTEGYDRPNYRLFFAKYDKKPSIALEENNVLPFNEAVHIIKTEKGTPVNQVNNDDDGEIRIVVDTDV